MWLPAGPQPVTRQLLLHMLAADSARGFRSRARKRNAHHCCGWELTGTVAPDERRVQRETRGMCVLSVARVHIEVELAQKVARCSIRHLIHTAILVPDVRVRDLDARNST
jgi:hypothetical protein